MPTTKYILEQIKIGEQFQDLIAKSTGENVSVNYNGEAMNLAMALTNIYNAVSKAQTTENVQALIDTAINNLIDGAPGTYDTLKEIADYIKDHEDVVKGLNAAIGDKASQTDFNALKAVVEGLGALAAKDTVSESDLDSALATKVNAAHGSAHTHTDLDELNKIVSGKVAAWDAKAEKTEATGTAAGLMPAADKAKLDAMPAITTATWDSKADKTVASTSANGLMSSGDKQRLDTLRGVRYGATPPSDMKEGELFVRVVTEG